MITVWGGGVSRSLRVTWLMEEMGLSYHLRSVDLLADPLDPEFLAVNPAGFIPAMQDGEVNMVESLAIMEYLIARYGPTPLAPGHDDPTFPAYQQFLHLGESGLGVPIYFVNRTRNSAPEAERQYWSAGCAPVEVFESRLGLVTRQLGRSPYLAGDRFTAADISVTYALESAQRRRIALGEAEQAYMARMSEREAYKRALEKSQAARPR